MEIGLHFTPPNLKIYKYIQNEVFQIIKMPGGMLFVQKREKIILILSLTEHTDIPFPIQRPKWINTQSMTYTNHY